MRPPPTPQRPLPRSGATSTPRPDALPASYGVPYRLRVTFPARMRHQRVHHCEVRAERLTGTPLPLVPTPGTLTVRPVIPGCLVTPADVSLDPAQPGMAVASFSVAPVALGVIAGRLEVLRNGQVCLQLPLHSRSSSRRTTGFVAVLAVVAPCLWFVLAGLTLQAGSVEAAVGEFLPSWCSGAGATVEHALAVCRAWEKTGHVGFWLAIGGTVATVFAAWVGRVRHRVTAVSVLNGDPSASVRARPLPPYLTPVRPDEWNPLGR
jgi:hypothetical protein